MSVNFDTGFSLWEVTLAGLCRPSLILFPVGYYSRWLMPVDFDTGYVGFFFSVTLAAWLRPSSIPDSGPLHHLFFSKMKIISLLY